MIAVSSNKTTMTLTIFLVQWLSVSHFYYQYDGGLHDHGQREQINKDEMQAVAL